jgi:TRAP-type C4-dicarboxylate transport system permease small subunit
VVFSYSVMYHGEKVLSHLRGICSVHIVTYGVIVNVMHGTYSIKIITNLVCTYFEGVLGWGSLQLARPVYT